MDAVSLEAKRRIIKTKSYLNSLREKGLIPGVVYGKGMEDSVPIMVEKSKFIKFLHHHHWENTVINMDVKGEDSNLDSYTVIVQEITHHPVSDEIIHIDFRRISLTEKVHVRVPVVAIGEPKGVKKGGVLEHMVWEIEIECLPTNIPEAIEVDVTDLDIGDSIHVEDVKPPEGVRILEPLETALFVVEYAGGGQGESEESESAEPEVIKQTKEEEK